MTRKTWLQVSLGPVCGFRLTCMCNIYVSILAHVHLIVLKYVACKLFTWIYLRFSIYFARKTNEHKIWWWYFNYYKAAYIAKNGKSLVDEINIESSWYRRGSKYGLKITNHEKEKRDIEYYRQAKACRVLADSFSKLYLSPLLNAKSLQGVFFI